MHEGPLSPNKKRYCLLTEQPLGAGAIYFPSYRVRNLFLVQNPLVPQLHAQNPLNCTHLAMGTIFNLSIRPLQFRYRGSSDCKQSPPPYAVRYSSPMSFSYALSCNQSERGQSTGSPGTPSVSLSGLSSNILKPS